MDNKLKKEIRKICTYHGDEGTSGYLLSEEQFTKIHDIIDRMLEGEKEIEDEQGTYKVNVSCSNCDFGHFYREHIEISKGQTVKDTKCPECGCKTLI